MGRRVLLLLLSLVFSTALCVTGGASVLLFPVEQNGKWGYINRGGKMVVPPQFNQADDFREGMAQVLVGNKLGYIDTTGKLVIPPRYDVPSEFSEGLAQVGLGGKFGYLDKTGKIVIAPISLSSSSNNSSFSEGLAAIDVSGVFGHARYGYIDKSGKMVIKPQFDDAYSFHHGLARVYFKRKCRYIDRTGRYLF